MELKTVALFAVFFSIALAATLKKESHHHIEKRQAEEFGDEENCVSVVREDNKPFELRSDQYRTKIQRIFFKQTIKYIECKNPGATCFENVKNAYTGMNDSKYTCQNSFTTVNLGIYNPKKNKTEPENIRISVGCVCLRE